MAAATLPRMPARATSALHGDTVELTPQHGFRSFLRMLSLLGPFRGRVVLSALLALATMVPTLVIPQLIGRAVDAIAEERIEALPAIIWLVLAAGLVRMLLWMARRLVAGQISLGLELGLRRRLHAHLLALPEQFHLGQQTGQLMSRITVDVSSVRFFLGYGLIYFFTHVTTIVAVAVIIAVIQWQVALAFYAMMPLMVWVSARYSRRIHGTYKLVQQRIARVTAAAEENIVGHRVVRSFGQEQAEVERFAGLAREVVAAERTGALVSARYRPLYDVLPVLTLAAVVWLSARAIDAGTLTIGEFVAFFFYLQLVVTPLRVAGNIVSRAQRATAASERIFAVLDRDDHLPVASPPRSPDTDAPAAIEFDRVGFAYPDGRRVLDDVSFRVAPGETVALLGRTGSGKSTVAALLCRAFDPVDGCIRIDGIDLREVDLPQLRRSVGVVGQEPFLFSDTVTGNIGFGRPDAPQERIEAVAAMARADEFVERLPDGYDTVVGERGLTLSGGQRQRLAIARALVIEPRLLVLDDATASVDAESESHITEALHAATGGQTTILIAHRPSTIRLADRAIVLDRGRIVAEGSHDELLASSPLYRDIFEQADGSEASGGPA